MDNIFKLVFNPENSQGHGFPNRTIPLANLLPQIKAVANRLVPKDVSANLNSGHGRSHIRHIINGSTLNSLCAAVLDSNVFESVREV